MPVPDGLADWIGHAMISVSKPLCVSLRDEPTKTKRLRSPSIDSIRVSLLLLYQFFKPRHVSPRDNPTGRPPSLARLQGVSPAAPNNPGLCRESRAPNGLFGAGTFRESTLLKGIQTLGDGNGRLNPSSTPSQRGTYEDSLVVGKGARQCGTDWRRCCWGPLP